MAPHPAPNALAARPLPPTRIGNMEIGNMEIGNMEEALGVSLLTRRAQK
jgi:hypothetical protein